MQLNGLCVESLDSFHTTKKKTRQFQSSLKSGKPTRARENWERVDESQKTRFDALGLGYFWLQTASVQRKIGGNKDEKYQVDVIYRNDDIGEYNDQSNVAIKRAVVDSIGNDWSFVEQVAMWLLYLWSCKTCQISQVKKTFSRLPFHFFKNDIRT